MEYFALDQSYNNMPETGHLLDERRDARDSLREIVEMLADEPERTKTIVSCLAQGYSERETVREVGVTRYTIARNLEKFRRKLKKKGKLPY